MIKTPFFSIVIPTYNRAEFIGKTLESIFNQTYQSFEILVIDDGSQDNTAEVVGKYIDSRLNYYPKRNEERGIARNYGFGKALGDYVIFLDSDDLFHKDHLITLYDNIIRVGYPNFIATKYQFDRGGYISSSDVNSLKQGYYGIDFFVNGNVLACNICVKRNNYNIFLFEPDRCFSAVEDWMFMLQNTQSDNIYIVDRITLTMNDHDFRSMRSNNSALIERWLKMDQWVENNLQLNNEQRSKLKTHIYYLCSIHSYADGEALKAFKYLFIIIRKIKFTKSILLIIRILLGRSIVQNLKKVAKLSSVFLR